VSERPGDASVPVLVLRRGPSSVEPGRDSVVAEEPLEIRVREEEGEAIPFVVTMRTPGNDEDLAIGLLFGEGVIDSFDEVRLVGRPRARSISPELRRNLIAVTLAPTRPLAERLPRRPTVMGSACGVCGRTSIEDVLRLAGRARGRRRRGATRAIVSGSVLAALPERLRKRQAVFAATGGLHATALFDARGRLVLLREDVGRHNATDKVVGALLRSRRPPPPLLLASGRLGFEIVQKAALAGAQVVAGISAPTSLAVDLAEEAGLTLVGFLRGERFNVYTHPERIGA